MKIQEIEIAGYGSLKQVSFTELGDKTVLVGKNGSGKSFIFEALEHFFKEFSLVGGTSAIQGNEYLWHRRDIRRPITMRVVLHFTQEEANTIIYPWLGASIGTLGSNEGLLKITRVLQYEQGWHTANLSWAGVPIVENDEIMALDIQNVAENQQSALHGWTLYLFEEGYESDNIGGQRLVMSERYKVAFFSNEAIDSLALAGVLAVSKEFSGIDSLNWAQERGYQLVERAPNAEEAPELLVAVATVPDVLLPGRNEVLEGRIRDSFMLIPAARDALGEALQRTSFINSEIADQVRQVSLSQALEEERKWQRFTGLMETLLDRRFDPNPSQLLMRNQAFRLPISYAGGGEQGILALVWRLLEDVPIVAIEEPENHLHPGLARNWFNSLEIIAPNSQFFISTHSSGMVHKDRMKNNWIIRLEDGESKAHRVEDTDGFKTLLAELGVLPSDVFFKDLVVFVEGGTERDAVLPIWAEKLGISLRDNPKVGLLSVGGEGRLKDNLRIWLEIMKVAPADYRVIVDEHSTTLVHQLVNEMGIPLEKFTVWSKRCIEDFYPTKLIVEALRVLYQIEDVAEKDIRQEPRAAHIKGVLEARDKIINGWKIQIGTYVAARMTEKQIPSEVKDTLTDIGIQIK